MYLLEVITNLELTLLLGNVRFHFSISIIDDSQEHVEQNEEYKEDICDEERWTKDTVGILDLMEVKVTKDDTKQRESTKRRITNITFCKKTNIYK